MGVALYRWGVMAQSNSSSDSRDDITMIACTVY